MCESLIKEMVEGGIGLVYVSKLHWQGSFAACRN